MKWVVVVMFVSDEAFVHDMLLLYKVCAECAQYTLRRDPSSTIELFGRTDNALLCPVFSNQLFSEQIGHRVACCSEAVQVGLS